MSLAMLSVGVLGVLTLGVGYVFAARVGTALALQERFAEAVSSKPPSENPRYYQDLREHREWTFRFGGVVLLLVGVLLVAASIYGAFVVQ